MDFCVGDRIMLLQNRWDHYGLSDGMIGTVRIVRSNIFTCEIGIEFDKNFGGHALDGSVEYGRGWWVRPKDIELIIEQPPLTPCDADDFMKTFLN